MNIFNWLKSSRWKHRECSQHSEGSLLALCRERMERSARIYPINSIQSSTFKVNIGRAAS